MKRSFLYPIRVYFVQAWLAYHGRYSITSPLTYITAKLGFPFFTMLFFIFLGKFVGFTDPLYIIIGNLFLIPASGGMGAVISSVGDERGWGTLSYVLGSPAPRAAIFLGRTFFYILDGLITSMIGFIIVALIFHIDLLHGKLLLLLVCSIIVAFSSCGAGLIIGSFSLVSRDAWEVYNTFLEVLYILVGVIFPITVLPVFFQKVALFLPFTRGVMAARMVINGSGLSAIASLLIGEAVAGVVYILIGYFWFMWVEKRSLGSGTIDAI